MSPSPEVAAKLNLLSQLVPLGDGFFDRADQMAKAGLSAFQPLMAFQESFCSSKDDIATHRQYLIELAKERLGNITPHPHLRDEPGYGYKSPFLSKLRQARADAGRAFDVYDKGKPWLIEVSPCRFAEMQLNYSDPSEYDRRKKPFLDEHRRLRHKEVEYFATDLSGKFGFEKTDRLNLCKAVLESRLGAKGFTHDRGKPRSGTAVLSKYLLPTWALCWVVDGSRMHTPTGTRDEDQIGFLNLSLEIQYRPQKNISGRAGFTPCQIPYNYVAPIDGLEWLYSRFASQSELEALLRAHLFVYELVEDFVETKLSQALQ